MVGHFSTPITPESGSFLHADSQRRVDRSPVSIPSTRWPGETRRPFMKLSSAEQAILDGRDGPARQFAMEILCAYARSAGAAELIPITGAYIGTAWYSGQAQLDYVIRLQQLGARVAVPTLLAASRVCLAEPVLNRDARIAALSAELADRLVSIGCLPTFSCSPYLNGHRPILGECVAWSESSAVVFANSVLGARTNQGYDFVDLAMAICGRAPKSGLYIEENRQATLLVDVSAIPPQLRDSEILYPVLGEYLGKECGDAIPLISGMTDRIDEARLRALGATASTAGSVRMFHMLGTTPEASNVADARQIGSMPVKRLRSGDLLRHRDTLSPGDAHETLKSVCLGAPHISLAEFGVIRNMLSDQAVHRSIACSVSTSRATIAELEERGWRGELDAKGLRIIADTCTYLGLVEAGQKGLVMTNSGKWAYFASTEYPVTVVMGSLRECIESAIQAKVVRDETIWSDDLW